MYTYFNSIKKYIYTYTYAQRCNFSPPAIGGGLDGLMILAALDRIEGKLSALEEKMRSKKRRRLEASGLGGPESARI